MQQAILRSCGAYLPQRVMSNHDLAQLVDTSDEWIFQRTGIKHRHIAADGEFTSDLATQALRDALANGQLKPDDIDAIIVATCTPDLIFPATACAVQQKIGAAGKSFAFDVNAVCSGFIYALSIANSLIKTRQAKRVAVIGAETYSRIVDWQDRATCVLFGDGAGCFILEAEVASAAQHGILACQLTADGSLLDILKVDGGPSRGNLAAKVHMQGREVFRQAIAHSATIIKQTLAKEEGIALTDIDWLVPHQANYRIFKSLAHELDFPMAKIVSTIAEHANTSAASIPLAMHSYMQQGLITSGQLLALCGFGAGFTAGCLLLRV
jgi:3-oxoacyl-[acyl-carrier-protein] synthase III